MYKGESAQEGYEKNCGISAGILEFFEIASEAWFLCLSFDMLISISNPFSTFKERYQYEIICYQFFDSLTIIILLLELRIIICVHGVSHF